MSKTQILSAFIAAITLFSQVPLVIAQEGSEAPPRPVAQPFATDIVGLCSEYFQSSLVTISREGEALTINQGETLTFEVVIENKNTLAIAGATLVAKVFKLGGSNADASVDVSIDQFVVRENLGLGANSKMPTTVTWQVPTTVEQGTYYVSYSLHAQNGQPLAGEFTADSTSLGTTEFTVGGADVNSLVTFEKSRTTIAGQTYDVTTLPVAPRNDAIAVTTVVSNPSTIDKTVTVQWLQYANHALTEANLRYTQTESLTIPAGESVEVSYDVIGQLESKIHLVAQLQDGDSKRMLNIPIVRAEGYEVRSTVAGLTAFPLRAGQSVSMVVCLEAPYTTPIPDTTIELTLLDASGAELSKYTQTSILLEDTYAFIQAFTPETDLQAVTLQVKLLLGGGEVESYTIPFLCEQFADSVCGLEQTEQEDVAIDGTSFLKLNMPILLFGVVLVTFFIFAWIWTHRKPRNSAIPRNTRSEDMPHYK